MGRIQRENKGVERENQRDIGAVLEKRKKEEKTCKKQLTNGTGSDNISKRFEQGTCSQAKARWETEYSS